MVKKKIISDTNIISLYMEYVLEHNENPKSVFAFAKANNFEESHFYQFFGSFEALEKQIFKAFFDNTIVVLEKSEDYTSFDARNKLLSFYFTFFENLTVNRSYVQFALNKHKNSLKGLSLLSELKKGFTSFIAGLDIKTLDLKQEQVEKFQKRALQESAWLQLLLTLKFWMDDTSASFEKTDIFIEKSVNTSFDILNITPLKSVIDFGKFIYKEKINTNN
ncbi:TetR family transcriptional regulator C-terminal domain-containing protein [Arenibacter latericius]|uniref:TetR family transcriptional regulator C-terminal domain-containing protein n=1 Tax=Arenibacter latericius TaxID=86104 RepID=UPI0003FBC63A|nr:TetR family transcriptional regulator C-terminal domain-containing protein [Arenibacter latericius]MDX1362869.1 TetR family transcriptional regulator C-terminal domain-containing protein [Arenibacter latericius]